MSLCVYVRVYTGEIMNLVGRKRKKERGRRLVAWPNEQLTHSGQLVTVI